MHPGAQLSGVYYVDDGGDREGGLRLVDPQAQASMIPVPPRWSRGAGERASACLGSSLFGGVAAAHVVGRRASGRASPSRSAPTFPDDDGGAGVYSAGGGGERVGAEPRLTFTVPPRRNPSWGGRGAGYGSQLTK